MLISWARVANREQRDGNVESVWFFLHEIDELFRIVFCTCAALFARFTVVFVERQVCSSSNIYFKLIFMSFWALDVTLKASPSVSGDACAVCAPQGLLTSHWLWQSDYSLQLAAAYLDAEIWLWCKSELVICAAPCNSYSLLSLLVFSLQGLGLFKTNRGR